MSKADTESLGEVGRDETSQRAQAPWRNLPTDKTGLVIDGRYRIDGLIGRGGMGSVYRAEHVVLGRKVAIKLLHATLASIPEVSRRFQREALAVGRIDHPNCVDVFDSGTLGDGSLYLVMEYLQGRSLGDLLHDEGRVAPLRALNIIRHVLCGLGHAHEKNIVHRDVKPENIILVNQEADPDFAKILDFGIAKLVGAGARGDDEVTLTQAGVAFGTPVYMSPEQAIGNPVDGRADLYAATVLLYEMIVGRPPFYSEDKLEVLSMQTTRPIPAFTELAPDLQVPPGIEDMVRRGLAKRPRERFASADQFMAAIDSLFVRLVGALPPAAARRPTTETSTASPLPANRSPAAWLPAAATRLRATLARNSLFLRPWKWAAAGAAAAALAGTAAASFLLWNIDKEERRRRAQVPRATPSLAERASARLKAGEVEEAIALLEARHSDTENDAPAQIQLAYAYAARHRYRDALRAFERGFTLDPTTRQDKHLGEVLREFLTNEDPQVALDAADLLITHLADSTAQQKLVRMASRHSDRRVRHRAGDLAKKHDLVHRVDWLTSYALDLQDGHQCTVRKQAVAKLSALDDKRAIAPLRRAIRRRGTSGRWRNRPINSCLQEDAFVAIRKLRAMPD